ncbi:MAG: FecR family protein [Candidatus Omnitrophica bacterium]|nr:FecR family protein [Candidatus Omnitrophota bacterium]
MRRFILLVFIFLLFLPSYAFGQTVKIIDVKGEVSVKKSPGASWEAAKTNTFLEPLSEIKTGKGSKCTLVFDEQMKNILTLKENSQIVLTETKPVNINLSIGKVFAIVDDIKAVEKFEIRTPTAVAGVRGTGESVEFNGTSSIVQCFKDVVNTQGLDANGALLKAIDLLAGLGVTVNQDGTLSATFELSSEELKAWEQFMDYIDDLRGEEGSDSSQELKNEQQQDYRGSIFEENRRNEEGKPQQDGGSSGESGGGEDGEYDYDGPR